MQVLIKYLPSIIAVLVGALSVLLKPIQGWISVHPAVATILAALYAVLAHVLPSPRQQAAAGAK